MKTINTDTNRIWTLANLPVEPDYVSEIEIQVSYTGNGNVSKGIALDHYAVPLFKLAPTLLRYVYNYARGNPGLSMFSDDEMATIERLGRRPPPTFPPRFRVSDNGFAHNVDTIQEAHAVAVHLGATAWPASVVLSCSQDDGVSWQPIGTYGPAAAETKPDTTDAQS